MGGHVAGEVASRVAVERSRRSSRRPPAPTRTAPGRSRSSPPQPRSQPPQGGVPPRQPPDCVRDRRFAGAARHGDHGLGGPRRRHGRLRRARRRQPGLAREGRAPQITHNHSWVEEQVRAGTVGQRGAPASVAKRRDARAVGRRRSRSGRHRSEPLAGIATCSARTGSSRSSPTSRSPKILGDSDLPLHSRTAPAHRRRPTRAAVPTTSRRSCSK